MDETHNFLRLLAKAMNEDEDYNAQDTKFVRDMIPHHMVAVEMAVRQIANGKNPAIVAIARAVKSAQTAEIAKLKKWLEDRGLSEGGGGM